MDDAKKKFGGIPDVQRALAEIGVHITTAALYKSEKIKGRSLNNDVQVALAHLVYNGDGNKFLRALEVDFMPKGLK
jgi:hypothetical protein